MRTELMPADSPERLIRIDAEHLTVRFLAPTLTIGVVILLHLIGVVVLNRLLDTDISPSCVMLPIDVAVFLGVGTVVERLLKRRIPSRRSATLSDEVLTITDARRKPPTVTRITWDKAVNIKAWRFTVTRRARVPVGWYCLALHLRQDEDETILYTFMSPQEAEAIVGYRKFVHLRPRKEIESNTDLNAVAEQRHLLKLEGSRWYDGADISPEDFTALLVTLRQQVPKWF
jgi:hypothetical protein